VLNRIESNLGLLVQRAMRVYSFSHLTFQEFLTARRIAKKISLLGEVGAKIGDRRWREVWLLLVTMLDADYIIPALKKQIDMLCEHDPALQNYLKWCRGKAEGQRGDHFLPAIRAYFFELNGPWTPNLQLARSLGLATTLDHIQEIGRKFDKAIDFDLDLDPALAGTLAKARASDLDLALDLYLTSKCDPDRSVAQAAHLAKFVAPELGKELEVIRNQIINPTSPSWRQRVRACAVRHRDIGHDWNFTDEQKQVLVDYYNAHLLLIESMAAARGLTTMTYKHVLETMLLPWDDLYASRC
jgi:hypothetical protein